MKTITLLAAVLLLTSCSSTKQITEDEFNTYVQELRYERDVYKTALQECGYNKNKD